MPLPPEGLHALHCAQTLLEPIGQRSGAVLYSGADTLRQGDIYLVGYNPGGAEERETIAGSLATLRPTGNDWCNPWGAGDQFLPIQLRVHSVFRALEVDPASVFTTNAIFVRSGRTGSLKDPWELWWAHCWRVHQLFLSVVRPRLIVCLGNPCTSDLLQTPIRKQGAQYERAWDKSNEAQLSNGTKWVPSVPFDLGDSTRHVCHVLALPHPSQRVRRGWNGTELPAEAMAQIKQVRAAAGL